MREYSIVTVEDRFREEKIHHLKWCISTFLCDDVVDIVMEYRTQKELGVEWRLNRYFTPWENPRCRFWEYIRVVGEIGWMNEGRIATSKVYLGLSTDYFYDPAWNTSLIPSFYGMQYLNFHPLGCRVTQVKEDTLEYMASWVWESQVQLWKNGSPIEYIRLYCLRPFEVEYEDSLIDSEWQTLVRKGTKIHLVKWLARMLSNVRNLNRDLDMRWHNDAGSYEIAVWNTTSQ